MIKYHTDTKKDGVTSNIIVIYDFDGTLTPHSLPQYTILKQCGYTDKKLMSRIAKEIAMGKVTDFYRAYYKCYMDILAENGIKMSRENVCLGAGEVQLNNGVEEYFKRFQSTQTGIKHYIVTSGIKHYVDETVVSGVVDGVFGVTFTQANGIFQQVDFLLSDKKKVDVIEAVRKGCKRYEQVLYFGDGLTDQFAFEHVHKIGGKSIFVASSERAEENYRKLNANGVIDEYFDADFSEGSRISSYIQRQKEKEQTMGEWEI